MQLVAYEPSDQARYPAFCLSCARPDPARLTDWSGAPVDAKLSVPVYERATVGVKVVVKSQLAPELSTAPQLWLTKNAASLELTAGAASGHLVWFLSVAVRVTPVPTKTEAKLRLLTERPTTPEAMGVST